MQVLGAPFPDVFLMKLRRGHPQDLIDMRALWPYVKDGFATANEVIAAFYAAFPSEPEDEFLGSFVVEELAKDSVDLPID